MDDKLTVRLSVRFSDPDFDAIAQYARARRLLPPDVIRMATIDYLRREGALPEPPQRKTSKK